MSRKSKPWSISQCFNGIISRSPPALRYTAPDGEDTRRDISESTGLVSAEAVPVPSQEIAEPDSDNDTLSHTLSPSNKTQPRLGSQGSESSELSGNLLKNLSASDATSAARHLAYLERKKKKRQGRTGRSAGTTSAVGNSTLDTHGFLSHLPEVHADIAYRFCFTVLASSAESAQYVIESICNNEMAESMNLPTPSKSSAEEAYRCLCPIPFDSSKQYRTEGTKRVSAAKFVSDVPKMAKLIFGPLPFGEPLVACRTRFEALSSALVCVLTVDPKAGEMTFHEQLLEYERIVDALLFTRKPLRPARAILLACHDVAGCESVRPPKGHMRWTERLAEYEMCVEENLWKFGPVDLNDAHQLLGVFGDIASSRILRSENSAGEDSDGSQQSDPPPLYEAEFDPDWHNDTIEEEPQICFTQLSVDVDQGPLADDDLRPLRMTSSGFEKDLLSPMERGAA